MGFDSLTVYPEAYGGSYTCCGQVRQTGTALSWATIIAAAGNYATTDIGIQRIIDITGDGEGYKQLTRSIFTFDTSSLTSSANISAATMSIYGSTKADGLSITPNINIYSSNPAANNTLENGDFDSLGSTAFSTAISYSSWANGSYNDFSLNSDGKSAISKTSITKLGARNASYDASGTDPGDYSNAVSLLNGAFSGVAGTGSDPKLVITYTIVATTNAMFFGCNF